MMKLKVPFKVLSFRRRRPVKAYWWRRVEDFGDMLAPLLLERFADIEHRHVEWAPVGEASVITIGSVLEHVPLGWRGYIAGAGLLRATSKLKFNPAAEGIKVLALRGPMTAKSFLKLHRDIPLGDPGNLANELVGPQPKLWDLGIVPHWQDPFLAAKFKVLVPKNYSIRVIDALAAPLTAVREIASCRRIVTSSLHGMIVADSCGLPRRFEICGPMGPDGSMFKFEDYSASIHMPLEIGKMQEASGNRVDDIKSAIWDAYRELGRAYGKR